MLVPAIGHASGAIPSIYNNALPEIKDHILLFAEKINTKKLRVPIVRSYLYGYYGHKRALALFIILTKSLFYM